MDFTGQSAIVTGAARGIGLVVAQRLREAGATVFMVDVQEELLRSAAAEIGATACPADVSDTRQVEQVVASAVQATGRVDVLFNNAGLLRDKVLWKIDDEDWERVVGVSLGGTFRFTRACVPTFRRHGYGRIVNVTSYTGLHGNFGQANYAAAKAGVIGFTKTAAKELARFGVTVNAISRGRGTVWGLLLGSLAVGLLEQLFAITALSSSTTQIVFGGLLLVVVSADAPDLRMKMTGFAVRHRHATRAEQP